MQYRINENVNLPFKVTPVVQEIGDNRIEFSIKVRSVFDRTNFATNVVIKIPVPKNTANTKIFGVGTGRAKYEPEKSWVAWRIKRFPGDAEFVMTGEATLTPSKDEK
jgi:AP-2 complex subunit mu-1